MPAGARPAVGGLTCGGDSATSHTPWPAQLVRSNSHSSTATRCPTPNSVVPVDVLVTAAQACIQGMLAARAGSVAAALPAQGRHGTCKLVGGKRAREAAAVQPCKRRTLPPAAAAASCVQPVMPGIERLNLHLIAQHVAAALASLPPKDTADLQAARSFLASF